MGGGLRRSMFRRFKVWTTAAYHALHGRGYPAMIVNISNGAGDAHTVITDDPEPFIPKIDP
jgi:hypothetical protein